MTEIQRPDRHFHLKVPDARQTSEWWRLLRPHTLTASIMPVLIGTAISFEKGKIDCLLFITMLFASILIQSAVNMFNEYFDFKRGLDTKNSVGIGGVIVRNEIPGRIVLKTAFSFFIFSVLLGAYICTRTSWLVAVAGSLSMLIGYLYSGSERPISYTPFGELTAGIFMGPMIVLIAFYIQTGQISTDSILLSIPISILVAAILLANNIRDAERDSRKGRRTIAVLLGQPRSTSLLAGMFCLTFAFTAFLIIFKYVSPFALISFACIPTAIRSLKTFRIKRTPSEMMPAMKDASVLHSEFGLLFTVGIILGKFFLPG